MQVPPGVSGRLANRLRAKAAFIRLLLAGFLILPALAFYLVVLRYTINVPLLDDFGSILSFSTEFARTHGLLNKLFLLMTRQYNDYKLVSENSVAALGVTIFGKINFTVLQVFGDLFVILIGLSLYLLCKEMFADRDSKEAQWATLITFLPVPYLIFQLNYWWTLNFAMAGLQHLPVVAFALLGIWCLSKASFRIFLAACIFFVLGVFSNANGLLLAPIGAAMLLQSGRRGRAMAWCAISIAVTGIYFYRYHSYHVSGPLLDLPSQVSIPFTLSFLGSAFALFSPNYRVSLLFGGLMLAVLAVSLSTKAARRENLVILYSALFIVLTAVGVSAIRSRLGLAESLAYHYRIYSDVLIALCYLVVAEKMSSARRLHTVFVASSLALAMAANLITIDHYAPMLRKRQAILACEVVARRTLGIDVLGIEPRYLPAANRILARAQALGIYALPPLAGNALPSGMGAGTRGSAVHKPLPKEAGRGRSFAESERTVTAECGGVPE
jgi:hypothetical protein